MQSIMSNLKLRIGEQMSVGYNRKGKKIFTCIQVVICTVEINIHVCSSGMRIGINIPVQSTTEVLKCMALNKY